MKKEYFLLGILSLILLVAGVWIYQIISEYQKAEQEYKKLQEYVKVEKNTKEPEAVSYTHLTLPTNSLV